jgi:hypothetical protein
MRRLPKGPSMCMTHALPAVGEAVRRLIQVEAVKD